MNRPMGTLAAAALIVVLWPTAWYAAPAADKGSKTEDVTTPKTGDEATGDRVFKLDEEWRSLLTPDQFYITRLKGTERPFSGKYNRFQGDGIFVCVCCGNELFDSNTKFKSGTGWPSFWEPVASGKVGEVKDTRYSVVRTEIICQRCDAHLGHLFNDGPKPTGLRYCINSIALNFVERNKTEKKKKQ